MVDVRQWRVGGLGSLRGLDQLFQVGDDLLGLSQHLGEGGYWPIDEPVALVSVYHVGGAYFSFSRSVFERRAPESIASVEAAMAPSKLGSGTTSRNFSDIVFDSLTNAYREARRGVISGVAS